MGLARCTLLSILRFTPEMANLIVQARHLPTDKGNRDHAGGKELVMELLQAEPAAELHRPIGEKLIDLYFSHLVADAVPRLTQIDLCIDTRNVFIHHRCAVDHVTHGILDGELVGVQPDFGSVSRRTRDLEYVEEFPGPWQVVQ